MTTTVTPTSVSWLLLATYAVLLGVGGLGVWVSFNNFGDDEPVAPTSPPLPLPEYITTTTTTASHYRNNYYDSMEKVPQSYKDYAEKSRIFARASDDARFFLGPPCMICVMVAAIVLVVGLCSRQLFSSTFCLYSSLGLWIATLTWTILYQNAIIPLSKGPFSQDTAVWILGSHVSLLLLLSVQILLCMWELRRQKAGVWPAINFLNVFTIEAALLAARLTLLVFIFASLAESPMNRGLLKEGNPYKVYDYNRPRVRYPLTLTILCHAAALYSVVATLETTLSLLLGKLHGCMTSLTCLLSALCSVTIAVVSSPVFAMIFVGPYNNINIETMNFAIGLSVVTFLHVSASLFIPTISRSPPSILSHVIDNLSEIYNLGSTINISERVRTVALTLKKSRMLHVNSASTVFSIISIILIATSFRGPEVWGLVMVLCVNFAIVVRTLPPVVMELAYEWRDDVHVKQKLMSLSLESIVLLVGAIAVCVQAWEGQAVFAGVMNIFFSAFQGTIMWVMIKRKLLEASQPEETQHLTEAEEVTSQCTDDQQNSIDAMA